MQNSQDCVPDPMLNSEQTGASEPMDVQTARSGVPAGSSSSVTIGASTTTTSNGSSTEPRRRPPQQYTGLARAEILRKLKREVVRFSTFQNWQYTDTQPSLLAKAGFFSFNERDKVQCAFCLGIIGRWEWTDDPLEDHRRNFPRCPFISGLPVGNIPIDPLTGRDQRPAPPPLGQINRGFNMTEGRPEIRVGAVFEGFNPQYGIHVNAPGSRLQELGVERHTLPAVAEFITLDARLKTFQTWPPGLSQKPKDLAEAGLYYTGVSDEVRCFHCDGGLKGWELNDDPWIEHAKWYPYCRHIILLKGRSFTEEARKEQSRHFAAMRASRRAEELMHIEPAISALNMGIDRGDVKKAILNEVETGGSMFTDLNALVNAASALALARALDNQQARVNNVPDIEEKPADPGVRSVPSWAPAASSLEVIEKAAPNSVEASSASGPPDILIGHSFAGGAAEGEKRTRDESVDLMCKICMDKKVAIVILPCGHLCLCADCASCLKNDCPICRKPFRAYVRAFLS